VPARRAPDSRSFPTDPKRVKAWISALPRANQAVAHHQLIEALQGMRELRLEAGARLAALEVLRPAVLEAIQLLDSQAQGGTLPLPPAKAKAVAELRAFEEEMAYGYRLAVLEICAPAGAIPFLRGGAVAQALERAMLHQSRLLMRAYFLYSAPSEACWSTLHALFDFTRSHKLEDKAVEEPVEEQAVTTAQLYGQALLLALSNPYRFSQREQADLWPAARDLSTYVSLHAQQKGADHFAVPIDGDAGPGYIAEERAEARGRLLWLDLDAARQLLEAPLSGSQSGPVSIRMRSGRSIESTVELLRRLRQGWGTATARSTTRLNAGHSLESVIGLAGLHYCLAGSLDFDTFMRQTGMATQVGERDRASWSQGAGEAVRTSVVRVDVLDQSLGGYRVRWPKEENVRARVGEVIGLAVDGDGESRRWMVGAIRWLRYGKDGSVDAGIALLARRARAVGIRNLDGSGLQRPAVRAVEYEPVRGADSKLANLIAPSSFDTLSRRIEIIRGELPDEFDQVDEASERCTKLVVAESAGDFLLLQATREVA
jgi:hypothetical protein